MAGFVNSFDTFLRGSGESSPWSIVNHTANVGGAWTQSVQATSQEVLSPDGELRPAGTATGRVFNAGAAGAGSTPNDIEVVAGIKWYTVIGTVGPVLRAFDTSVSVFQYYQFRYSQANARYEIGGFNAGVGLTPSPLGSFAASISPGDTHIIRGSAIGTALKLYVDGVQRISVTNALNATGGMGYQTQTVTGTSDTVGPHLQYIIARSPLAADGLFVSGPTSGDAGNPFTFYVMGNGNLDTSGPITVTPNDGGAGGTFTPSSIIINETDTPIAVFTYQINTAATPTLTFASSVGGVANATLNFTSILVAATAYTVTGPSSGELNAASSNFSATANGSSTDTVTPHSSGVGTFTPTSVTFTGPISAKTFTYTPTVVGDNPHVISFTNSGSLTNPANLNYLVTQSGESLTLSSPVVGQAFAMNLRNGSGQVIITGTLAGFSGARTIEASYDGTNWTTVCTVANGVTSFSGSLLVPAGQWTIRVRDQATQVGDQAAGVGVTIVGLWAGQSNDSGRFSQNGQYGAVYSGPLTLYMFGNDYLWQVMTDPTDSGINQVDTVSLDSGGPGGSYMAYMSGYLAAWSGLPVAGIPCAKGGTTTTDWLPSANPVDRTTLFGSALYRAQLCGGVSFVYWHQGETNITSGMSNAQSLIELKAIAQAFASHLGVPFIAAKLQSLNVPPNATAATTLAYNNEVIQALWDLGLSSGVAPGPDLYPLQVGPDGLHLNSSSAQFSAAQLAAKAIEAALVAEGFGSGGGDDTGVRGNLLRSGMLG